jgi:hypothetical protein
MLETKLSIKINIALLYMSTLAILIRAHGNIPLNIDIREPNTEDHLKSGAVIPFINYKTSANITNLTILTLARLGGVCYGSPLIQQFLTTVNQYYQQIQANTEQKINEIFGPNSPSQLREYINQLFGISFAPEKTLMTSDFTINKIYTKYDDNSGVLLFSQDGISEKNLIFIRQAFASLTSKLQAGIQITRQEIFAAIAPYNIQNVYFLDLTCNAYFNTNQNPGVPPLTEDSVNWINGFLTHYNIKGGVKSCKKCNKYKKCKKHKKTRKNKKRKGNNKKTKSKK